MKFRYHEGFMARPRLFLIDSYGFIFRAYHARARSAAPPMRTSKGLQTEAVFIFNNMLRKLQTSYKPEYIAAIFESLGPTFRSEEFADYKANRTEMPDDLSRQIPYVRRVIEALRIPIVQYRGFEADDVIGAISRMSENPDAPDVVIVSSDKDMLQLVNGRVSMLNPMKDDAWYDPAKAEEFMGVPPSRVPDYLALVGDTVDNIPGAPGIGEKGARDLILRFGDVETTIARAAEVERKTYRESLLKNKEQILLSKKLATIDCSVPIDWQLDAVVAQEPDVVVLRELYRELEFFSLLKELQPVESLEDKDYKSLLDRQSVEAFLAEIPPDSPVAVAVDSGIGLAYRSGQARGVPFEFVDALKPLLEDERQPKIAHDIKSI